MTRCPGWVAQILRVTVGEAGSSSSVVSAGAWRTAEGLSARGVSSLGVTIEDGAPRRRPRRDRLLDAAAIAACVVGAFLLRVQPLHDAVFTAEGVRFQGNDAWYHARLVDNLVANFPRPLRFDPLARFPGGAEVPTPPLLDLTIAGIALVAGAGAPSQRLTETVAAYLPPVLGSLVVVPVFLLGRRLFGRGAGLLGAAVLAVLPGQFLARSALGFTDHHVAETALTTLAMLLLFVALASVRDDGRPRRRAAAGPVRAWAWAALAGAVLALYFLTWSGAALFAAIVVGWAALQIVLDHLTTPSRPTTGVLATATLLPPLLLVLWWREALPGSRISLVALGGGLAAVLLLASIARVLAARGASRWWMPLLAVAVPAVLAVLVVMAAPAVTAGVAAQLERMAGTATTATVSEGLALLRPGGRFEPALAWLQFASGSFLAPLAFGQLAHRTWREPRPERVLFLLWTVVVVAATLGQNRFAYYSAVNVAVLAGAAAATVLEWGRRVAPGAGARAGYGALAGVAVVLLVFAPALRVAVPAMGRDHGPSAPWLEALDWLRERTPEPFPGVDAYLRHYGKPGPGGFPYPPTAYGVLNWWDEGYWILRRARRIPTSIPTQAGARESARFLLAQDEGAGLARLEELGARYVMVDRLLVYVPTGNALIGRFPALAHYAGREEEDFVVQYWLRRSDGALLPLNLLRPEYYQTMVARLYLFRGRAVEPRDSTWLVKSQPLRTGGRDEARARRIEDLRRFASWAEAAAFLDEHPGEGYEVVGRDPARSCVPLAALDGLRQVYPEREEDDSPAFSREVRIFEVAR